MATFSIGEAVNSGLRIVRRHPAAVLIWSLAYFVILLLPQLGGAAMIWSSVSGLQGLAEQTPGDAPSPEVARELGRLQAYMSIVQIIQFAGSLLWASLFYGAVFRAELEPQNHARGFVRLSRQELWLGVVLAVAYVLLVLALLGGMMPLIIYGGIVGAMGDPGVVDWIGLTVMGLAVFGVICWAAIRLSLGLPMSFAERSFRLFESWSLTRGHAGRIFLTFLATFALVIALEMLVFGLIGGVVVVGGLSFLALKGIPVEGLDAALQAMAESPPDNWVALVVVAVLVGAILLSMLGAVFSTIAIAPAASIYRQLTAKEA